MLLDGSRPWLNITVPVCVLREQKGGLSLAYLERVLKILIVDSICMAWS